MTAQPVVVVGTDGTRAADAAVAWAAAEAAGRGATLRIVDVWHSHGFLGSPFFINPIAELVLEPERNARHDLATARDRALKVDASLDVQVVEAGGPAAITLLENARDAALLVIGSTRRSALDRAVFGSVTTHAVTYARCPVVVVRVPDDDGPARRRVVVGFDRSEPARVAATFAFDFARRHGLDVVVVDACELPPGDVPSSEDNLVQLYRETFPDAIGGVAREFPDVAMTSVVEYGHPSTVLLRHVADAELLVVGSRGRGHFEGMLLGSVSASLVHHAPVSVAVVR